MTNHHHLLKVYGTKKTFFYDFDRNYFFNDRKKSIINFSKNTFTNEQKSQVLLSFVKSLLYKNFKPKVNFNDIKYMMNISLAVNKSLRSNKIVKVDIQ